MKDLAGIYAQQFKTTFASMLQYRASLFIWMIGQVLEMTSDDPASEADMKSWTARTGHELVQIDKLGPVYRFVVRKTR